MKISFGAKITVNPNIYKGLEGEDLKNVQKFTQDCVQLMEIPQIKKATESDTLEISKATTRGKNCHNVQFTFNNEKFEKPIEIELCGTKASNLKANQFIFHLMLYLHRVKLGLPQRYSLTHDKMVQETIEELKKIEV